jgi:ferredoxin
MLLIVDKFHDYGDNRDMSEKVSVTINGISGEVKKGSTLLEASKQIGSPLAHLCLGNAICSTCRVKVVSGDKSLSPKEIKEEVSLNYHLCFDEGTRLSCQCKLVGDEPVVVQAPKPFSWLVPPWSRKKPTQKSV